MLGRSGCTWRGRAFPGSRRAVALEGTARARFWAVLLFLQQRVDLRQIEPFLRGLGTFPGAWLRPPPGSWTRVLLRARRAAFPRACTPWSWTGASRVAHDDGGRRRAEEAPSVGGRPAKDLTSTGLSIRACLVKSLGVSRAVPSPLLSSPPLLFGCQLEGRMVIN